MLHKHHKIPRHMGGTDDPSNLIWLTVEEHAEEHRKLYEEHGHWQDRVAWQGLAGIIGHEEAVRQSLAHMKGKNHTPETLEKLRQPKPPGHAEKVGAARRGKKHTDESKRKMSEARKANPVQKTAEHLEKLNAYAKKPKSPETRVKMAEARRLYWARKKA